MPQSTGRPSGVDLRKDPQNRAFSLSRQAAGVKMDSVHLPSRIVSAVKRR